MADLVESLMKLPGAVAVARVSGETTAAEPAGSELRLLIYYRGSIKADDVRALGFEGEVSPAAHGAGSSTGAPHSRRSSGPTGAGLRRRGT